MKICFAICLSLFFAPIWLLSSPRFFSAWDRHVELTVEALPTFAGWCSAEKAKVLMNFIAQTKPKICVEIGSFGGSTTYPILSALSFLGEGFLYAIDAWDSKIAVEGLEANDPNYLWWSSLDMDSIYHNFLAKIGPLEEWCQPICQSSDEAVRQFAHESIDFLYIDGNFSDLGSYRDVTLYFPKVKKGGYIWVNDGNFPSKRRAVAFLMENASWIKEKSMKNRCIVFRK